ncbi:hypothetical protein [Aeoliella mucimassa]|uniref:hypothetical protein n=1 Tax=Aeoliella mucimassa TaxID=2527972 RepID=UPI0011AA3192|nr:hypothetical protein [Aeoliella mucimassa]
MSENPYESPEDAPLPIVPLRVHKGRNTLLFIAGLLVLIFVWDVVNYNHVVGWSGFPQQLFRLALPLGLTYAIWTGRNWTRYVLAIYCLIVILTNLPMLQLFEQAASEHQMGNLGLIVLMLGGHAIVAGLAMLSTNITNLILYRQDQKDLA